MSAGFDHAVGFVIAQEGGLTTDSGGLTKYGISQRAYPGLEIAKITLADAKAIYKRDYWDALRLADLPPRLAMAMLDAAVNTGRAAAVTMLQRLCNDGGAGLAVDGVMGPQTMAAAHAAAQRLGDAALACMLVARRLALHADLAKNDKYKPYLRGWVLRCGRLIGAVCAAKMEA